MRNKNYFRAKVWQYSKGAISILLAVLLLPFYSLAAVLVEAGRYQNSAKALDAALGSSAISTLAQYESYLEERFGLLAVQQTDDSGFIQNEVEKYLSLQDTVDIRGVSGIEVDAQGVYPLSDVDVLRQQVLDAASVMVPAKFAVEVTEIDQLISQLEKSLGISKLATMLSSGAKLVSSEADLVSELDSADKKLDDVKSKKAEYDAKYTAFAEAVTTLTNHLASEKPDPEEDESGADDWEATAEKLRKEVENAKTDYQNAIQEVIDELQTLHDSLSGVVTKSTAMVSQVASFEAATGAAALEPDEDADESEKAAYSNMTKINDALSGSAKDVSGVVSNVADTFTEESFVQAIDSLQKELNETNSLKIDSFTGNSAALDSAIYHATDLSRFTNSEDMKNLLKEMEAGIDDEAKTGSLFSLFEVLNDLVGTELLWDGRLNSRLNLDYYQSAYGGLTSSKGAPDDPSFLAEDEERARKYLAAIDPDYDPDDPFGYGNTGASKLAQFIQTVENFVSSLMTIKSGANLFEKMNACSKVLDYGGSLCSQISGLGTILTEALTDFQQREVLMGYLAYNMPNRTNFTTGTTLTGYSFSKIALAPCANKSNAPLYGGILPEQENYCFNGAELEYIMCGNPSESSNQKDVFTFLWGMRMLLDFIPVICNGELQNILSPLNAVPYVGPILWIVGEIAVLVFEPLLDCYVLVNGESVPIVKTTVYLSPSGALDLAEVISKITIKDSEKRELTQKMGEWCGVKISDENNDRETTADIQKPVIDVEKWGEAVLSLDYTEHLLILMSLFGSDDTYLERLADLIQCEMTQRNLVDNATIQQGISDKYYDFDIDEAYTAVRLHATGSTVQVLPVPSLSTNSMFRLDRVIYRGY